MNLKPYLQALLGAVFCLGVSGSSYAQADTIQIERHVFGVTYLVNNLPMPDKQARQVLFQQAGNQSLFLKAGVMTGTAITSAVAGTYLIVDALRGVPAVEIDLKGQEIPYTVRSQSKFFGGLGVLVLAGCLSQYALDLKVKAVNRYNQKERGRTSMEIGYLSNNHIGFRINLP